MFSIVNWLERVFLGFVVVLLMFFGLWQGLKFQYFSMELFLVSFDFVWMDALFSVFTFSIFTGVSLVFLIYEIVFKNSEAPGEINELVSVVVPVYKDSTVLTRCVESVLESTNVYIEVLIVAEEDDIECISVADELASKHDSVRSLVNKGENGKAASINYGVERSKGDYLAFFDADQTVHPKFLEDAVTHLSDYEIVQGRRIPEPEGFIESISYYEKVIFRLSSQLIRLTSFETVLSSSTVMRKEIFESMNGYRNDRATEDIDFGHRCFRQNINTVRAETYPTYMKAPHNFKDLWGQKKRWVLGQIEVLHGNIKTVITSGPSKRLVISTLILSTTIFGNLLMLTLIPKFFLLIFINFYLPILTSFLILSTAALILRIHDIRTGKINGIGWTWLLIPFIYIFYSSLIVKSIFEYAFTWEGQWYRVEK